MRRAGEFRQPVLQPQRRFEVEMVGRLVEQQQVGLREQRGGQRHAHPPAAGEFLDGPRLGVRAEAETGQDRRGARRCRVGVDRDQPVVDFGEPVRVRVSPARRAAPAARCRRRARCPAATRPRRRLLLHPAKPGAGRQPDLAAIEGNIAGDGAQQRRLAGAVAADQADAAAGIDRQVGGVEQRSAGDADGDAVEDQQAHAARCSRPGRSGGRGCCAAVAALKRRALTQSQGSAPWPSARSPFSSPTPRGAT